MQKINGCNKKTKPVHRLLLTEKRVRNFIAVLSENAEKMSYYVLSLEVMLSVTAGGRIFSYVCVRAHVNEH